MPVTPLKSPLATVALLALAGFVAGCAGHMSGGPQPGIPSAPARMGSVPDAGTDPTRHGAAIPGAKHSLAYPIGLAESAKGELYVSNNDIPTGDVIVYNAKNQLEPKATITAGIDNAAGLAFDRHGDLYVANYTNQTVTVYDSARKLLKSRTLHTDKNYNPSGVQIDKMGRVWVANRTNNNITIGELQVFNSAGKVVATATQDLVYPLGIAFSPKTTDAWIGNSETPNDTMAVYSQSVQFVKTVATSGFTPTYLAYAKNRNLYVTDGLSTDIEVFNARGKVVQTITDGLDEPYGIAFNKKGDFYAANVANSTITEYDAAGKLIATIK